MSVVAKRVVPAILLVIPASIALYATAANTLSGVAPPAGAFGAVTFYGLLVIVGACLLLSLGLTLLKRTRIYVLAVAFALLGIWRLLVLVV